MVRRACDGGSQPCGWCYRSVDMSTEVRQDAQSGGGRMAFCGEIYKTWPRHNTSDRNKIRAGEKKHFRK